MGLEHELPKPGQGEPKDPLQKALDGFQRRVSAQKFDPSAVQHALDNVRATHNRLGTSPAELYANLAALSGMAVDLAGKKGTEADQKSFAEQQLAYQQSSEQFAPSEEHSGLHLPTNPKRTTGRASG